MLWTFFKLLIGLWLLQAVLQFGGSAIRIVLAVLLATLLLRLIIRRSSFGQSRWHVPAKSGSFAPANSTDLTGASRLALSLRHRI